MVEGNNINNEEKHLLQNGEYVLLFQSRIFLKD